MDLFRRLFNQSEAQPSEKHDSIAPAGQSESGVETAPHDTQPVTPPEEEPLPAATDGATRPLPIETVITTRNEHLLFGQSTDIGMVRNNNQDAALSFFFTSRSADELPDFGLFIVADGMGGHQDGEKASAMTAHTVAEQVMQQIYLPMLNRRNSDERIPITETLISTVQKANTEVMQHVPEGGTTLTAVTIIADLAYIVHVGDSRVYMISKDGLEQITRDHSLVQRLIELDQLTQEEVADHPQKNVLYRALGQNDTLEVDAITRRLPPNSRLLLCSDGLWNQVTEEEIVEITMSQNNPQEACDKLVALANKRGGADNITTILLQIPSS